ncbi:helix-turn-helix transcriptional regulator [Streptomyces sp. NPDC050421]|uniref:helix-turn-helix transcriptional regulator n=1 Tax=Streptomyces sp. NPDC050421 TaxID=3365613 RepID=UPI0037997A15
MATNQFITTNELATLLRTTPQAVRNMRHRGAAPRGFRRGRGVLYARADVDAWIASLLANDRLAQRALRP